MTGFAEALAYGQVGEGKIANWLKWKTQASILPVYETEINTGKGPRIFAVRETIIAPDMLVFPTDGFAYWVEAKHKTVFTWHRISGTWQTGIDRHHYRHYLKVRDLYGYRLCLAFLHCSSRPDSRDIEAGCPPACPTGLFVGEINSLRSHIDHEDDRWGKHGMVYWQHGSLIFKATLEEVEFANTQQHTKEIECH